MLVNGLTGLKSSAVPLSGNNELEGSPQVEQPNEAVGFRVLPADSLLSYVPRSDPEGTFSAAPITLNGGEVLQQ